MRATILFGGLGVFLFGGCILLDQYNYGEGGAGGGGQGASTVDGGAGGASGSVSGSGAGGGVMVPTWSRRHGDANPQGVRSVAVADDGSVYVTGGFNGTIEFGDLDPGKGHKLFCSGSAVPCPYLMRLDAQGNPIWVNTVAPGVMGGTSNAGTGAAVIAVGNDAIWAGNVPGDSVPPGGATDIFVQRISAAGLPNKPVYLGGMGNDKVNAMVYDNGMLYLAGTISTAPNAVASAVPCAGTTTTGGDSNLTVFALDATALTCKWGQVFGGGVHPTDSISVGAKPGGNVFVSGDYEKGGILGTPPTSSLSAGSFVLELGNMNGQSVRSMRFAGTDATNTINIKAIKVDANGVPYVAGAFAGSVLDSKGNVFAASMPAGNQNAFVASLDPMTLSRGKWLDVFGGTDVQLASGLAVRGSEVFLTGKTVGPMAVRPNDTTNTTMCDAGKNCIFYFRLRTTNGDIFNVEDTAQYSTPNMKLHAMNNAVIAVNGNARAIAASAAGPVNMTASDDLANDPNADDEPDLVIGYWPAPPP